ncbi:ABC transporter permease [Agromyces sp. LHK192]|uniref:ABC transporter permease n=1 Tax=Agromyces sp. LHK192 TaxID=2498704 RepID=UPI000FD8C794|nr:ABC transporter permease [Agromyces sp. LHK192]
MSTTAHTIRAGVRRGAIESFISLKTPGDSAFVVIGLISIGVVVWFNRSAEIMPGVPVVSFVVPSILTIQLLFIACYGLATVIVTEREDGTLIRARSLPGGVRVYAVGVITKTLWELVVTVGLGLVITWAIVGSSLGLDVGGVAIVLGMLVLGTIALTTFGLVLGVVFRNPRAVGGWGIIVVGALAWISGLIQPLASMAGWLQVIGQISPLYWIGVAFRSAFVPEAAQAVELGGDWRVAVAFAVVAAWAIAGALLAPRLLRRAARRETGSAIEARREAALRRA